MFRWLVILGNLTALGILLNDVGNDMPDRAGQIIAVFSVIFLLTSNIFLLMCSGERGALSQWLFIIIKRKTLEERKRIKELESEADDGKAR